MGKRLVKINKIRYYNPSKRKFETRWRIGRKSPLFYTKAAAIEIRKITG